MEHAQVKDPTGDEETMSPLVQSKEASPLMKEGPKGQRWSDTNATAESSSISESSSSTLLSEEKKMQISRIAENWVSKRYSHLEFAKYRLEKFPKFDMDELLLGKVLGKGEFGIVKELKAVTLPTPESSDHRAFIRDNCRRDEFGGHSSARYAVKQLQPDKVYQNEGEYYTSVRDISIEAHLLAAMEHPHIVKMRGLSTSDIGSETFFVIVDRLHGTLRDRISEWRAETVKQKRPLSVKEKLSPSRKAAARSEREESKRELLERRLRVAHDLTSAVLYLHSNHIIDRDLKPENVGFNMRKTVKLFDFGLSTEFSADRSKKLTAKTGSLSYMAPENYKGLYYDEKIDIFSLSIVIWEIVSLASLYPGMSSKEISKQVLLGDRRPPLTSKCFQFDGESCELPHFLSQMWKADPTERPTAKHVLLKLKREIAAAKSPDDVLYTDLMDFHLTTRQSTYHQERFTELMRSSCNDFSLVDDTVIL